MARGLAHTRRILIIVAHGCNYSVNTESFSTRPAGLWRESKKTWGSESRFKNGEHEVMEGGSLGNGGVWGGGVYQWLLASEYMYVITVVPQGSVSMVVSGK